MIFFSNKNRPVDWGPYPLERLPRDASIVAQEANLPRLQPPTARMVDEGNLLTRAIAKYHAIFRTLEMDTPAAAKAPVPDDLARRTQDIKGSGYFLDASQMGICAMPEKAWLADREPLPHSHAIIVLIAHGRLPECDNLAHDWVKGQEDVAASMRAFEISIAISEHIQQMGWQAKAHDRETGLVDLDRLTVLAGLAWRDGGQIINPYAEEKFSVAVVTTDYALAIDEPLAGPRRQVKGLGYWLGVGGAVPGIEWNRRAKRATHMSAFPLEQVDRVDKPTTLILDEEIPRVPKRAEFFERAARGDLGKKSQVERSRFAFKHPFAQAMVSLIRSMVPEQDGPVEAINPNYSDPAANARMVKSLSYYLGSEMTGICEVPRYAWYSHNKEGVAIKPYNKYAIVMLIDQGYETMEGASGDDYISGAQSMRAYMRGAEIAGIMGELFRSLGYHSRAQTNADSDVLHVPVTLLAGLGELSRIGEVILNPFIGPRLKTVVLTTDLPMEVDKPMDFGLQYFCDNCVKCARECPCDAITWGDKVMFNGYEMWKPDVERCTRYRLTNARGLACGRCMKTCPLNKVVTAQGPIMTRIASWCGVNVRWLKPFMVPIAVWLDDFLRNGVRNPVKKWWLDLEIVNGICVEPVKGVNKRDLNLDHVIDPAKQKIAYYHADRMPPPNVPEPVIPNRKEALARANLLETPLEARQRRRAGKASPLHYTPTPAMELEESDESMGTAKSVWDKDTDREALRQISQAK